jgi:hypothetical protein
MYAKTLFLKAAATLPFASVNASYYTWLDLGCHPPMCAQGVVGAGVCLAPRLGSPGRLRVARAGATAEGMEEGAAGAAALRAGPAAWVRQHRVVLAGTVFGALRGDVPALMRAFQDALVFRTLDVLLDGRIGLAPGAHLSEQERVVWQRIVAAIAHRRRPGVSSAVGDKLFEPFVSSKGDRGGTGLGLSICRGLVEAVGGRLDRERSSKAGTRFALTLPAERS